MWDFHSHQVAMLCLVVMDKVSLPPSAGLRVGLGRFHLSLRVTDTFLAWGRVPTMRGHWPLCGHLPQSISRTPSLGNGQSQRALHFVISSQSVRLPSRLCGASSCWGLGVQSPTPASKGCCFCFSLHPSVSLRKMGLWDAPKVPAKYLPVHRQATGIL